MIGDLVAKLIAAGATPEAAAEAVAEAFAAGVSSAPVRVTSADESVTRRRESDRLRQQRRRDNLRTSRDNPQTSQVASTLEEEKIEEIKQDRDATPKPVTSRGHRLADTWAPTTDDWQAAIEKIGPEQARLELAKFRDYWKSAPGRTGLKLDWDATFRNWIRNARGPTNGQRSHHASRRPAGNDFFAGIASVAADIAGNGESSWPPAEEIPAGKFNIDG